MSPPRSPGCARTSASTARDSWAPTPLRRLRVRLPAAPLRSLEASHSSRLPRLRRRAYEDLVDVDVRRLGDRVHDRSGDVVGLQAPFAGVVEERRVDLP